MNVYGYIRLSGSGQIDGDGIARQEKAIKSFCDCFRLHNSGTFQELAVSGTVEAMDRPQFAELIEYIDARTDTPEKIEAVVVERMDRLARDLMVSELLLTELRERDIKVYCADQGMMIDMASNEGDPTRVLIRQIMGALAQWEKTMLVRKLKGARDRKKAAGGYIGGTLPFGTLAGEEGIKSAMLSLQNSGHSLQFITDWLNESGIKTRKNTKWGKGSVESILTNHKKKSTLSS